MTIRASIGSDEEGQLTGGDIFGTEDRLSRPFPSAVRAFRQIADGATPPDLSDLDRTDAAAARDFAIEAGDEQRYDHRRRAWRVFNSPCWDLDRDGRALLRIQEHQENRAIGAISGAKSKGDKEALRFALRLLDARRLKTVLELAAVQPGMAMRGDEFDADPFMLGVRNGIIDLRIGRFRPARPDDLLARCSPVTYDADATCPRWLLFLLEVFVDVELVAYIKRAVGYSAIGDVREQVIFLNVGEGENGKSTLLDTLTNVLGDYAYACPFSTFEAGQRSGVGADLAVLDGPRFITSSETDPKSRFNTPRMKALSGGDKLNARHLYGHPFEFHPQGKLWLATNHKPAVDDDSHGFWRRLHLIPYTRTFSGSARDNGLKETLQAEAPGILNWIIEGAIEWQRDGLQPPAAVLAAADEYRQESDPLREFIEEACVVHADARVPASQLYTTYTSWSQRQGIGKPLGRKGFSLLMAKRVESKHAEFGRLYLGIGVRADV